MQTHIPFAFICGKGLPGIGIMLSIESDLITVVNTWRTRIRQHEQPRQLQRILISARTGEEARCIVAIQEIHLSIGDILFIQSPIVVHAVCEIMSIDRLLDPLIIGLLMRNSQIKMFTCEKGQHRLGELVIHYCIKLVTLQPALGFMPDLAHDVSLWVTLSYPK